MLALFLSLAAMPGVATPPTTPLNPIATVMMRCSAVTAAMGGATTSPITLSAQAGYFMLAAAHADPGDKDLMARTGNMSDRILEFMVPAAERPALLASCKHDYPQAYRTTPSTLPSDSFARDTMCLGAAGIMVGAAQSYEKGGGNATYTNRYQPLLDRISGRLTDKLLADHGYKADADFQRYMGGQLYAALSVGNVETVTDACLKLPG